MATGDELKPIAAAEVDAFEAKLQERVRARGGEGLRLTSAEKLILMDYIYFKWLETREPG